MAAVASIEVRGRRELAGMLIRMAIGATFELDLEESVFSFMNMALGTLQPRMSALQRIRGQRVLFHRKRRRLPAVHGVARGTFSSARTFRELSTVRIGLVAVHALGEYQRLLEICVGVTLRTTDRRVFPFQRKLGLRVIEVQIQRLCGDLLPAACAVARLASLRRKASTVRVFVAIRALAERKARILSLAVCARRMALRTLHLCMQSGQRIPRFRVIELLDVDFFPAIETVTLLAVRAETSFMSVFMTAGACRRETEIGPAQVLDLDRCPILRGNVGRIVALIAC